MSHEIDMSNNRANIAFLGAKPWHGLGHELPATADLDTWREAAGLDWSAIPVDATYQHPRTGQRLPALGHRVLIRSDNMEPLSLVSKSYQIVQPGEVLEFYRDLTEAYGFQLETAGCLFGGRRVWALARTGLNLDLGQNDQVNNYLLLATSFDGTMATVASYTTVRVVCWNTMQLAVGADGAKAHIRVGHGSTFNADEVKANLGLAGDSWGQFSDEAKELTKRRVSRDEVVRYFVDLLMPAKAGEDTHAVAELDVNSTRVSALLDIYTNGVGQRLETAYGTAWGLVNAVTRYYDHERKTRTLDNRLEAAWFGQGRKIKEQAWQQAVALVD